MTDLDALHRCGAMIAIHGGSTAAIADAIAEIMERRKAMGVPGPVLCTKCGGSGFVALDDDDDIRIQCDRCGGTGKEPPAPQSHEPINGHRFDADRGVCLDCGYGFAACMAKVCRETKS